MERKEWNQFVLENGPRSGAFLQSWDWGEFQQSVGEQVRREELRSGEEVTGVAQWLDRSVPGFGSYAYCPKGPVGAGSWERGRSFFSRIEPEALVGDAARSIELNPAHTLITNLLMSEEELQAQMHRKTRYNIRVAAKHGVEVNLKAVNFDELWRLFEQTAGRGHFKLHARSYYEAMLRSLTDGDCGVFLATASHDDVLLAANVMIDFGDTRTYLHGASASEGRKYMAPYALHWALIQDAKAQGMKWYDWWGVAPEGAAPDHAWSGISRFKRGFGGEEVGAIGTVDVVDKPMLYKVYKVVRWLRRKIK
ncbi:MAG: peptidoglycan bridge formation glycyltransferase FemA/FemB family protein [bacterium]|jgi:peptidoglycan pentaglycine glycine transferase (the first glycine)|nr:peptidoglycan bridge formation glycyltransferase FemA/FemB family protein [bacterium]